MGHNLRRFWCDLCVLAASEALLLSPLERLIKTVMEKHMRTIRRLQADCRGNNSFDIVSSLDHLGPSACAITHTLLVSPNLQQNKNKQTKIKKKPRLFMKLVNFLGQTFAILAWL